MEVLAVIWAPVRALARVAEERRVLLGFVVTSLHAALNLVSAVITVLGGGTAGTLNPEDFPELPPELLEDLVVGTEVVTLLSAVLSPFVGWLVVSSLMQLVTRFFGGTGPISGTLAVVGVAGVPLVLAGVIQIPASGLQVMLGPDSTGAALIGVLLSLLLLAAYIWNVFLVVIGTAFARGVSYGQSAGSCAISCAGCVGLIILTFVIIVAVVAAIAGALSSVETT